MQLAGPYGAVAVRRLFADVLPEVPGANGSRDAGSGRQERRRGRRRRRWGRRRAGRPGGQAAVLHTGGGRPPGAWAEGSYRLVLWHPRGTYCPTTDKPQSLGLCIVNGVWGLLDGGRRHMACFTLSPACGVPVLSTWSRTVRTVWDINSPCPPPHGMLPAWPVLHRLIADDERMPSFRCPQHHYSLAPAERCADVCGRRRQRWWRWAALGQCSFCCMKDAAVLARDMWTRTWTRRLAWTQMGWFPGRWPHTIVFLE